MPQVIVTPLPPHKKRDAYDAGAASLQPREHIRLDDDGFPMVNERHGGDLTVRVRRAASEKWVSRTGNVIYLRAAVGSGQPGNSDPSRHQRMKEKLHAGQAIRYATCPIRDQLSLRWVPPDMRNQTPCKPGTFGNKQCCKHIEEIMRRRLEASKAQRDKRLAKGVTMQQRTLEQNQRLTERLLDHVGSRKSSSMDE